MRTVTFRIRPLEVGAAIKALRRWLNRRGSIATACRYDTRRERMLVIKFKFTSDDEAGSFTGAFRRAVANPLQLRRNERSGREG